MKEIIMFGGKSRIGVYAILACLAGFMTFAAKETPRPLAFEGQAFLAQANITDVRHNYYGKPPPEIGLLGTGFGETRGTRTVRIDETPVMNYYHWGDTDITFSLPFPLIYWEHAYQFAIVDGLNVVSNVFSKRFLWDFVRMTPNRGPVGTEVSIGVCGLPASPEGLVLKIETVDFPIIAWTPAAGGGVGTIKAKVPTGVDLGLRDVYLQKGDEIASTVFGFRVVLREPPPQMKKEAIK